MNKALATATVLLATLATGCTDSLDKSGGDKPPTTLTLASADGTTLSAPGVLRFVQLVEDLSDGRVQVEVSPDWRTKGEQKVLEDVAAGKAALAWSGTRALDTIGVDTFRPLHAPFLIDSYAAQRAVVADGVAQEMLAGLDSTGLTGLAVLADELRLPAGAAGPLRNPGDFEKLEFGIVPSNVQAAGVAALGARPKAMLAYGASAIDGLGGLETMWSIYSPNGQFQVVPFVTANAALWPRTTVIVANTESLDGLSQEDRDIITRAATQAAEWSVEHADDQVADEMERACLAGARIATASPGQLDALRNAAASAYAAMRSVPEQAGLLARVEKLVQSAGSSPPVPVPEGCAYRPADEGGPSVSVLPDRLDGPGRPGNLPAGTYRYAFSNREIRDEFPEYGADFADANAGVWTWTLGDGRWSYEAKLDAQEIPEGYAGNTCEGYYDVHGNQVDFTTLTEYDSGDCAPKTWKADWKETQDGLAMDVTSDGHDYDFLFGAKTWEQIE